MQANLVRLIVVLLELNRLCEGKEKITNCWKPQPWVAFIATFNAFIELKLRGVETRIHY